MSGDYKFPLRIADQSLVTENRSSIDIFNYSQTIDKMRWEDQGKAIRGRDSMNVLIEAIVAHSFEVEVFNVGTLNASLISTRVRLVDSFR